MFFNFFVTFSINVSLRIKAFLFFEVDFLFLSDWHSTFTLSTETTAIKLSCTGARW